MADQAGKPDAGRPGRGEQSEPGTGTRAAPPERWPQTPVIKIANSDLYDSRMLRGRDCGFAETASPTCEAFASPPPLHSGTHRD
jgi:hypothetical protein